MTDPLQLFNQPATPTLTDRQQHALNTIQTAGQDGIHADELGAALHQLRGTHKAGARCLYCGQEGVQMTRRLRDLGLVRYRAKLKTWVAVETAGDEPIPADHVGDGPVPFNAFPAGF
jgi:hypothetical protein